MKKIRINWWDDAALWTRQIMEAHYTRKLDAVMEWLAEDVMGIGPVHAKYAVSYTHLRNNSWYRCRRCVR